MKKIVIEFILFIKHLEPPNLQKSHLLLYRSPTDKSPKEAPAPKSAGTPEGIITTDKDSILS